MNLNSKQKGNAESIASKNMFLRPAVEFPRSDHQTNSDFGEKLEVTYRDEVISNTKKVEEIIWKE
jgi:hypothetical protein